MDNRISNIYLQKELDELISSGKINESIKISGQQYISFQNLNRINGSLGINNPNIDNLGSLNIIKEDLWINCSPHKYKIESLGLLKEISGNASLSNSNIKNLGKLKKVGGSLILNNNLIEDLGILSIVGEDLILPIRLKETFEKSKIIVGGKVKFQKDSKSNKINDEEILSKSKIEIPFWYPQYIYSLNDLENANLKQRHFYKYFRDLFLSGEMIDLEGNDNYIFILLYDLFTTFTQTKNYDLLKSQFELLETYYPITKNYTQELIIEYFKKNKEHENAWEIISSNNISLGLIIEYQNLLRKSLLDSEIIIKLIGYSYLTEFGKKNIESIKEKIIFVLKEYEEKANANFLEIFILNREFNFSISLSKNIQKIVADFEYYKKYFPSEAEYQFYYNIDMQQLESGYERDIFHVVEKAINNQLKIIVKKSEDLYRESIGMPKVGEGWISETELYYLIKLNYPKLEVLHHASPKWLGRQHLDIYIPEYKIGIEYQGIQHYQPVEFFGGQDAFYKNVQRDHQKRIKCNQNNCHLIYVDEGYNFDEVKRKIDQLILERSNHQ